MVRQLWLAVHRWLGVALALPVCVWFLSGIAMMYCDFPAVTADDRLARSAPLDPRAVALSPAEAARRAGVDSPVSGLRLAMFDGRPLYRIGGGPRAAAVFADTGEIRGAASAETARRIAAAWTALPADGARAEEVLAADQWTLEGALRTMRPMWKFSWPDGQEVYVSSARAEVVQYTTRASRLKAYLGPVPHWIYFPIIRRHPMAWTRLVDVLAGAACLSAVIGLLLALQRRRYRGIRSWHVTAGIVFGAFTVSWTFSGLLSMDPFPLLAEAPESRAVEQVSAALRPLVPLDSLTAWSPRDALASLNGLDARELDAIELAGQAAYVARLAGGDARIVSAGGALARQLDAASIGAVAARAVAPQMLAETRLLDRYDRYYLDRRHALPLPVVLVRVADEDGTRLYIDPKRDAVVATYVAGDWSHRWLYHGLHSWNFPWLYEHRPAWDLLVIACMLGGAALSGTAIVLAWGVISTRWLS